MASGQQLVDSAKRFLGEPYSTAGGRCSQTSGFKDCSGLVSAALSGLGIFNACGTSTSIETWATRNGGHYVTRDYANRFPGVGLAIWGYSRGGHIGISMGNNMQIETPSAQGRKVGYSPMSHDRWGEYFTFPGITEGGAPAPPEKPKPKEEGMIAIDSATGYGWHWSVGWAHLITSQKQYQELKYAGNTDIGTTNMYVIGDWMAKYGAWAKNGVPRRIEMGTDS